MRSAPCAELMVVAALTLATTTAFARVQPVEGEIQADEIMRTLKRKICRSRTGATFTFGNDGRYTYDGLWTDHGHYSVHDGAVTILLDSGLERDFAISRRAGVLYMEETAVSCA